MDVNRNTEDKQAIIEGLKELIKLTRAGQDVADIVLDEDEYEATIIFRNGHEKPCCVHGDSGISIIRDIVRFL